VGSGGGEGGGGGGRGGEWVGWGGGMMGQGWGGEDWGEVENVEGAGEAMDRSRVHFNEAERLGPAQRNLLTSHAASSIILRASP